MLVREDDWKKHQLEHEYDNTETLVTEIRQRIEDPNYVETEIERTDHMILEPPTVTTNNDNFSFIESTYVVTVDSGEPSAARLLKDWIADNNISDFELQRLIKIITRKDFQEINFNSKQNILLLKVY